MAIPTILPSGQLHPDLVNNAAFVKHVGNVATGQTATERVGAKIHGMGMDETAKKQKEQELTQLLRSNVDIIDLSPMFSRKAESSGKTVIDNRASCGLIIETIDPTVVTADDANKSAAVGGATHGFFYHKTDFLFDAAKEYAKLGENEVYRYRNINDVNFVRDTLDFFTGGNYTQYDVNAAQDQITDMVYELAQQLKDGGSADLSKVQTKLTIGGEDVSLSQILEMQKMGRDLSESFDGFSWGSLNGKNTQAFAEMGIAKSIGNHYGSDKGEIGRMFSDAIDRLYEKGVAQVQKGEAWARSVSVAANTSSDKAAVKLELNIAELFSKLDTADKSSLSNSFSSALTEMRAMVQQYCNQHGLLTSHVGLAGATDNVSKFFQSWLDKV